MALCSLKYYTNHDLSKSYTPPYTNKLCLNVIIQLTHKNGKEGYSKAETYPYNVVAEYDLVQGEP